VIREGKASMSDRNFERLLFIALIIAITVAIIAVNHVQEVQSKKWQQEQEIQIEEKLNGK